MMMSTADGSEQAREGPGAPLRSVWRRCEGRAAEREVHVRTSSRPDKLKQGRTHAERYSCWIISALDPVGRETPLPTAHQCHAHQ